MKYDELLAKREKEALQAQLQRALHELQRYQEKYDRTPSSSSIIEIDKLPKWVTAAEVMTPLLRAYDSKIEELENIATEQIQQVDDLKEKVEKLTKENESLKREKTSFINTNTEQPVSTSSSSSYHDNSHERIIENNLHLLRNLRSLPQYENTPADKSVQRLCKVIINGKKCSKKSSYYCESCSDLSAGIILTCCNSMEKYARYGDNPNICYYVHSRSKGYEYDTSSSSSLSTSYNGRDRNER